MTRHGPERLVDQGIGVDNVESAHRLIHALLTDDPVRDQVDLVALYRHGQGEDRRGGSYEVWSRRGLVRFERHIRDEGGLCFTLR